LLLERFYPAIQPLRRAAAFNLVCFVPFTILDAVLTGLVSAASVLATNRLGGGLVTLSSTISGIVIYTFVLDCGEYLFHRAQHRIPLLWSMHSFHHSDRQLNCTTTFRHFWAERALKSITIYFAIGLVFKPSCDVIIVYSGISFLNYFFHMNIPFGFGRGWFLLNSPQYHRVHHSLLPEHYDTNFAALFPVFDLLFGTAHRPGTKEFPATGLRDDAPRSLAEAIVWPVRKQLPQVAVLLRHFANSAYDSRTKEGLQQPAMLTTGGGAETMPRTAEPFESQKGATWRRSRGKVSERRSG
jgi:sterol desaturase/sphingolipid hydroxylase (fatty acid hydroxylase superfamily)